MGELCALSCALVWAFAVVLFHTVQEGADAAPLARRTIEAFGESFPERRWW